MVGCSCDKAEHVVLRPLELVCRKNAEEFGMGSRKALEISKWNLMDHLGKSFKEQNIKIHVDMGGLPRVFRGELKDLVENWNCCYS